MRLQFHRDVRRDHRAVHHPDHLGRDHGRRSHRHRHRGLPLQASVPGSGAKASSPESGDCRPTYYRGPVHLAGEGHPGVHPASDPDGRFHPADEGHPGVHPASDPDGQDRPADAACWTAAVPDGTIRRSRMGCSPHAVRVRLASALASGQQASAGVAFPVPASANGTVLLAWHPALPPLVQPAWRLALQLAWHPALLPLVQPAWRLA